MTKSNLLVCQFQILCFKYYNDVFTYIFAIKFYLIIKTPLSLNGQCMVLLKMWNKGAEKYKIFI